MADIIVLMRQNLNPGPIAHKHLTGGAKKSSKL